MTHLDLDGPPPQFCICLDCDGPRIMDAVGGKCGTCGSGSVLRPGAIRALKDLVKEEKAKKKREGLRLVKKKKIDGGSGEGGVAEEETK